MYLNLNVHLKILASYGGGGGYGSDSYGGGYGSSSSYGGPPSAWSNGGMGYGRDYPSSDYSSPGKFMGNGILI